jgi:hypothetical protein
MCLCVCVPHIELGTLPKKGQRGLVIRPCSFLLGFKTSCISCMAPTPSPPRTQKGDKWRPAHLPMHPAKWLCSEQTRPQTHQGRSAFRVCARSFPVQERMSRHQQWMRRCTKASLHAMHAANPHTACFAHPLMRSVSQCTCWPAAGSCPEAHHNVSLECGVPKVCLPALCEAVLGHATEEAVFTE